MPNKGKTPRRYIHGQGVPLAMRQEMPSATSTWLIKMVNQKLTPITSPKERGGCGQDE